MSHKTGHKSGRKRLVRKIGKRPDRLGAKIVGSEQNITETLCKPATFAASDISFRAEGTKRRMRLKDWAPIDWAHFRQTKKQYFRNYP